MKMVSLQLSDLEYTALEDLVFNGRYPNRSAALRKALLMLVESHKAHPWVIKAIKNEQSKTRKRPRAERVEFDRQQQ